MSKNQQKNTTLLITGVPERLKRTFKSKCARNGVSMKEILVDAIERYVTSQ
jgi:hypothetical protein